MGAVHHHGRGDAQHVRNIAEIDDEVVVAVNIAALGEPYLRSARYPSLVLRQLQYRESVVRLNRSHGIRRMDSLRR